MDGKQFTYKVVEESKEDPIFNVIEKGNITARFSLYELNVNIDTNKKLLKGLEGKLLIEQAKIENIERNHPFVKDFTPEERFTIHMYEEACAVVRGFPEKIEEIKVSIAEMEQEKVNLAEQIGIAIPKEAVAEEAHADPVEAPEKPQDL